VDIALGIPLDVDPKEVDNGTLDSDLESGSLHILHLFQQLGALWASEDGVITVKDIDEVLTGKDAWTGGQLDDPLSPELGLEEQQC